jgi:hypothetical protein
LTCIMSYATMRNVERMRMVKRIGLNPLNVVKGDLNLIP